MIVVNDIDGHGWIDRNVPDVSAVVEEFLARQRSQDSRTIHRPTVSKPNTTMAMMPTFFGESPM